MNITRTLIVIGEDPALQRRVQGHLFALGFVWAGDLKQEILGNTPCISANSNGTLFRLHDYWNPLEVGEEDFMKVKVVLQAKNFLSGCWDDVIDGVRKKTQTKTLTMEELNKIMLEKCGYKVEISE